MWIFFNYKFLRFKKFVFFTILFFSRTVDFLPWIFNFFFQEIVDHFFRFIDFFSGTIRPQNMAFSKYFFFNDHSSIQSRFFIKKNKYYSAFIFLNIFSMDLYAFIRWFFSNKFCLKILRTLNVNVQGPNKQKFFVKYFFFKDLMNFHCGFFK